MHAGKRRHVHDRQQGHHGYRLRLSNQPTHRSTTRTNKISFRECLFVSSALKTLDINPTSPMKEATYEHYSTAPRHAIRSFFTNYSTHTTNKARRPRMRCVLRVVHSFALNAPGRDHVPTHHVRWERRRQHKAHEPSVLGRCGAS